MILIAYRHGLRVKELCNLEWSQVDFKHGLLHVARLKGSICTTHPLRGVELRALRRLQREQELSRHVWMTERGAPMTTAGFRQMLRRTGAESGVGLPVHPHMLRHACGYKLANESADTRALQLYLGHKDIRRIDLGRPATGSPVVLATLLSHWPQMSAVPIGGHTSALSCQLHCGHSASIRTASLVGSASLKPSAESL